MSAGRNLEAGCERPRDRRAARAGRAFEHQHLLAGLRQVVSTDKPVVARTDDDHVRQTAVAARCVRRCFSRRHVAQLTRALTCSRRRHVISEPVRGRTRSGGKWKDVQIRERQPLDRRNRLGVLGVGFSWESGDDVGTEPPSLVTGQPSQNRKAPG